jgi:hypothetical protein
MPDQSGSPLARYGKSRRHLVARQVATPIVMAVPGAAIHVFRCVNSKDVASRPSRTTTSRHPRESGDPGLLCADQHRKGSVSRKSAADARKTRRSQRAAGTDRVSGPELCALRASASDPRELSCPVAPQRRMPDRSGSPLARYDRSRRHLVALQVATPIVMAVLGAAIHVLRCVNSKDVASRPSRTTTPRHPRDSPSSPRKRGPRAALR